MIENVHRRLKKRFSLGFTEKTDGDITKGFTEKQHVWQLFAPTEFISIQFVCEKLEYDGWTIENIFQAQKVVNPKGNVLQLNKNAQPQMVVISYPLASKWMTDDEFKQHQKDMEPKDDMNGSENGILKA